MKSSRQRIIDFLVEHKVATASEFSRVLNLTAADVRHHLTLLTKQGSLSISGYKLTQHKGRPARLYTLSAPMARHNLDLLAHHLLLDISMHNSQEYYCARLKGIAERFTADTHWETSNFTRRIYKTVKLLQDMNYDASWEAHAHSPQLILGHCPFGVIINQHPELCQMDSYLIESLLGTPVYQLKKLVISSRGLPQCIFILQDNLPIQNDST